MLTKIKTKIKEFLAKGKKCMWWMLGISLLLLVCRTTYIVHDYYDNRTQDITVVKLLDDNNS